MKTKKKKKKGSKGSVEGKAYIGFDEPPKKSGFDEPWYKKLPYLEEPSPEAEKKIRAVRGFYELFMHYVRFKSPKTGNWTGFRMICPDYDREVKQFRQGSKKRCPICLHFNDPALPDHLNFRGSFKYYFDAFDISAIQDDEGGRTFGVVICGKYGRKDIVKATKRNKASVGDLDRGCTLYWERNRSAEDAKDMEGFTRGGHKRVRFKKVNGKGRYVLTYKDADGSKRKIKGKPTNFDKIVKPPTPEEMREDLDRLGLWDELEKAKGKSSSSKKSKKGSKIKTKKKKRKNRS
jgi:hypothetical protein